MKIKYLLLIVILGIIIAGCDSGNNSRRYQKLEKKLFDRADLIGTWFLKTTENTNSYMNEIYEDYVSVDNGKAAVIRFEANGIYEQLIGVRRFTGKWEIENNKLTIWYDGPRWFIEDIKKYYGISKKSSTVSLDNFFINDKNFKEGMVELIYSHPTREECRILQFPIYK